MQRLRVFDEKSLKSLNPNESNKLAATGPINGKLESINIAATTTQQSFDLEKPMQKIKTVHSTKRPFGLPSWKGMDSPAHDKHSRMH